MELAKRVGLSSHNAFQISSANPGDIVPTPSVKLIPLSIMSGISDHWSLPIRTEGSVPEKACYREIVNETIIASGV